MRRTHRVPLGALSALSAWRLVTCAAITSLLLLTQPASAALEQFLIDGELGVTGRISVSVDGVSTQFGNPGDLQIDKPYGATVNKAYLFLATTILDADQDFGRIFLSEAEVTEWVRAADNSFFDDPGTPEEESVKVYWADVTDTITSFLGNDPVQGVFDISVTEELDSRVDGTVLVVIFDDPNAFSERGVALMLGFQNLASRTTPDTFSVVLPGSYNAEDEVSFARMGLGISHGCLLAGCERLVSGCQDPDDPWQYSLVEVNGELLSSAAGGQDDYDLRQSDGVYPAIPGLTVGGIGDNDLNPADPNLTPMQTPDPPDANIRIDDELYDLWRQVDHGDRIVSVSTTSRSCDDNIFFAYLVATIDPPVCGDEVVDPGETCDDGNVLDGDCCSSQCQIEEPGTECRAAVGLCDVAEVCDGVSDTCPGDGYAATGTVCRLGRGLCDTTETCSGVDASCPPNQLEPEGTECRAAVPGGCDLAEACDGESATCPEDVVQEVGTLCRGSAGVCDAVEACSGQDALCPPDGFQTSTFECRASADFCDVAEYCTGAGVLCPADGFRPAGMVCRRAHPFALCDVSEACTGLGASCPVDGFLPEGTVCRGSEDPCDAEETCTGASAFCAEDGFAADGSPCPDDLFCNGLETCQDGVCTDGPDPEQPGKVCREDPIVHGPTEREPGWPEGIEVAGAGRNQLAYLAAEEHGLRIYNVSDPAYPRPVGSYLPEPGVCPLNAFLFDDLAISGTTAYIAAGICGLLIVDVSDPAAPVLLDRVDTPGWAKGIKVHTSAGGTMAYVADYWGGLRIIQLSGPDAPVELGSLGGAGGLGGLIGPVLSTHVVDDGGRVLVYATTMQGFFVIDASFAALPVVLGSLDTNPSGLPLARMEDIPQDALVIGDRAYLPIWMGGLLVLDLSDPTNPVVIQEFETVSGQAFFKVAAGGANVYVTEGQCGLRVFGTTGAGLAEAFFETINNPIDLGSGEGSCTEPSLEPWAWDLDEASGVVFASSGVVGPPREGSFQSIDFRQPGSGLLGTPSCGLGSELVLLLPLLAWCRRTRRHS